MASLAVGKWLGELHWQPIWDRRVWKDHIDLCGWSEECGLPLYCSGCSSHLNCADLGLDHQAIVCLAGLDLPEVKELGWGRDLTFFGVREEVPCQNFSFK